MRNPGHGYETSYTYLFKKLRYFGRKSICLIQKYPDKEVRRKKLRCASLYPSKSRMCIAMSFASLVVQSSRATHAIPTYRNSHRKSSWKAKISTSRMRGSSPLFKTACPSRSRSSCSQHWCVSCVCEFASPFVEIRNMYLNVGDKKCQNLSFGVLGSEGDGSPFQGAIPKLTSNSDSPYPKPHFIHFGSVNPPKNTCGYLEMC